MGLYGYKESIIQYKEEKYIVRSTARATLNTEGRPEYKIEIIFPETASVRYINVKTYENGTATFAFTESPDHRLAENILKRYRKTSPIISFASDMVERRIGSAGVRKLIGDAVAPKIFAVRSSLKNNKLLLENENKKNNTESGTVKIINAIIDRFFVEQGENKK